MKTAKELCDVVKGVDRLGMSMGWIFARLEQNAKSGLDYYIFEGRMPPEYIGYLQSKGYKVTELVTYYDDYIYVQESKTVPFLYFFKREVSVTTQKLNKIPSYQTKIEFCCGEEND